VFATETLAAGVNMPARATVISTLSKKIGAHGGRERKREEQEREEESMIVDV